MNNKLDTKITFGYLFMFALPTLLSNVFMGIYGVVDGFFAGKYIGTDALSCVNICMPIVMISLLIGIMLGSGGNALISKKLGEGKLREAKEDFTLINIFGICVSILICLLCFVFRYPLIRFLGADEALLAGCIQYTIPILILVPLTIPGTIFEMTMITVGKPNLGLAISVLGGLTNIFLDWLLIVKLDLGLMGAATATGIGYCVPAVLGMIFFIFKRDILVYFVRPKWRSKTILKSCGNGSSEMVGLLATGVVTILMNNILMKIKGSDGVAAVSVILYAQSVFSAIARGYSIGISPIISYKFGQKNEKDLQKIYKVGEITTLILSVVTLAVCLLGTGDIVALFTKSDAAGEVSRMAVSGFKIFVVSLVFAGMNIFTSALFTALNDGKTSAILSFTRTFIFMIVPLLILPNLFGMNGVWWSFVVSEGLAFVLSGWYMIKLVNH